MKIRLETSDGHYVAEGKIPPFVIPPDVVMWGLRVFKLYQDLREYGPEGERHGHALYRECFYFAMPVEAESCPT